MVRLLAAIPLISMQNVLRNGLFRISRQKRVRTCAVDCLYSVGQPARVNTQDRCMEYRYWQTCLSSFFWLAA